VRVVCIMILLNILFQALRCLDSLSAGACRICLMLSWENLELNIISFMHYATAFLIMIYTSYHRVDLVCSLTHLVIVIVPAVEAKLIL
jgi:hypothetical protein